MTKQEINSRLEQAITKHGFTFDYHRYSWMPVVPQTDKTFASINIMSRLSYGAEKQVLIESIYCEAHICQMGGMPTSADLLKVADEITRAAALMDEINAMGLTYVQSLTK